MAKSIKAQIETVVRDELKQTRGKIKNYVEKALLSLIGLERGRWKEEYEIDHCNSRNSVLIDAFRRVACEEAEKLARSYKPTNKDIVAFQKAFEQELHYQVRLQIKELAKGKGLQIANEIVDKIKLDVDEILRSEGI